MFNKLIVISFVVMLLVSAHQTNSYATEVSMGISDLINSENLCNKVINSCDLCVWKNQTDNMPVDVINFLNNKYIQKINRISKHILFLENLTLRDYIATGVESYNDENGNEWYVRYCMQTNFEVIASVVSSQIHNILVNDDTSNIDIKFVVALDKDTPTKFNLIGAATRRQNFKSVFGLSTEIYSIGKPSNLEKEYAIWHFLSMPPASSMCIGFVDSTKEKVGRFDYHTAFSYTKDKIEPTCFKTSEWILKHYECDLEKIGIELSKITDCPYISEIIDQTQESLALLRVDDIDEPFKTIRLFLNKWLIDLNNIKLH